MSRLGSSGTGGANNLILIFTRQILNNIIVNNHCSMINSDIELISGDITLLGDSTLILL